MLKPSIMKLFFIMCVIKYFKRNLRSPFYHPVDLLAKAMNVAQFTLLYAYVTKDHIVIVNPGTTIS